MTTQCVNDEDATSRPSVGDAERGAACALTSLAGVGGQSLALFREQFGSLAEAVVRGGEALAAVEGLRADAAQALRAAKDLERRGRWLLETARAKGIAVLLAGEEGYPARLREAKSHPPVLYVMGALPPRPRVALVGSRHPDPYGLDQTQKLAASLAGAGLDVVSGGAEGVDTAVHEKVLAVGGRTVAVVGTGLLKPYPVANGKLYEDIARNGAVVSEFALDAGGQRGHFPQRNRTIAGLSDAVVMMRGTSVSGALSTCEAARRAARPVFAVPGRLGEALSEGPNGLIAAGHARLLRGVNDLLAALSMGRVEEEAPDSKTEAEVRHQAHAGLSDGARRLYAVLSASPRHVDELAREAGLTAAEALGELLKLELEGLCRARPGTYFLRR